MPSENGSLFPSEFIALLNATGKQFIERAGQDLVRHATTQILLGHNVRTQTEPLTRQRIAEVSGALLTMFERGARTVPAFYDRLPALAIAAPAVSKSDVVLPPRVRHWLMGLTGKSVQNVLRSDKGSLDGFAESFDKAILAAADQLESMLGPLQMSLNVGGHQSRNAISQLSWREALRIMTTVGCAELAIRGSDKSRYGKLFERLVLGSVLTILGFTLDTSGKKKRKAFWLSDTSGDRECDATLIVEPGRVARFDIGFIGIGNPEIVRDKLSRFAREVERGERNSSSTTIVIVDRYPTGPRANSRQLAEQSGAVLVQMSMSFWPRELATALLERFNYRHPLAGAADREAEQLIRRGMKTVDVLSFLRDVDEGAELDDGLDDTVP